MVITGVVAFSPMAYAANSTLSVVSSTTSKTAGTSFTASVQVNPQGNQVCVVKGTLNFSNLTCNSITLAPGLLPQTSPTCSNPSFTIGIPKCTTAVQNILTVSVKGRTAGQASIALSGANVIGAGTAVAFSANGGSYNITAALAQNPVVNPAHGQQNVTQSAQQQVQQPLEQPVEQPVLQPLEQPIVTEQPDVAGQQASLANISPTTIYIILGILLAIGAAWALWAMSRKKKIPK